MKVIHGVVTLEQAKRLQELGYVLSYDGDSNALEVERPEDINHDLLYAPESPF